MKKTWEGDERSTDRGESPGRRCQGGAILRVRELREYLLKLRSQQIRSDKEEEDFEEELCENAVTFLHFDVFCQFLYIAYMVAPKSWLYDLQCPCKYILDIRICYVQALESCKIITFSTRARGIQHHWIKRKLQAFV